MLTDLHVHLRPDEPSATAQRHFTAANAQRYRTVASERGITELGCSEHVYRFAQALDVWEHPLWRESARDDLDAYVEFLRAETDLRVGIEADFVPGREDRMATLLEARQWDYVVGAVHFLGDLAIDHGGYDIWDHRSHRPDEVWARYFETLGEAARSGLFDVLAHPDLVKVWGARRPRPEGDLRRFYERAMEGIAESAIAVEVSTAGLRKPAGELYPAPAFLEMVIDAGNPIALSSDAHTADELGFRYEDALEALDRMGVGEVAVFEGRQRRLEPLG
ncbi:MAG TPA: PHP domain-containing protein [Solirubrobacteraceae bacterium]|nr:PHP domain-containing protein [Solirubrobacteraceae bacterium]